LGNSPGTALSDEREAVALRPRSRKAPIVLLAGAFIVLSVYALAHPLHDFVEYWTASRLLVAHQNPYSIADVAKIEHSLGFEQEMPLMLLSPPCALALIAPLGLTQSYGLACFFWTLALIMATAVASRLLMDVYFGDVRLCEISDTVFYRSLFAFTFFPVLLCLRFAQTVPFALLGLAGFVYFERRKPFVAGALLSLTLIKPHLVLLVWAVLILHCLQRRRWSIVFGALGAVLLLTGISLWFDHHILRDYLDLTGGPYLQAYAAGIAALIRKPFGGIGTLWIQLIPTFCGLAWLAVYWRKHRNQWSWNERLPMVLTVSVLTCAYGWAFDETLLALPVMYLAGHWARRTGSIPFKLVVTYSVLNLALMLTWPIPTVGLLPAPIVLIVMMARKMQNSSATSFSVAVGSS